MADLPDVESALLSELIAITYPNGTAAASILGPEIRLYRGWPVAMSLASDIAAGISNVNVFPVPGSTHNSTRWGIETYIEPSPPALTVSVSGHSATFGGACAVGQLAGILADNVPFVYVVQLGDSPALVASELYDAISVIRPCQISGATVTVPGAVQFVARTTAQASGIQEWARQEQGFRVSVWAPSPALRDTLCGAIGSGLAPIVFLPLADGTAGRVRYRSTASLDDGRDASTYRRDLVYDVEYATTISVVSPTMLFGDLVWNGTPIFA